MIEIKTVVALLPEILMESTQYRPLSAIPPNFSLLVGAPKGDSGQFNTTRAGAIFSCGVNTVQHIGSRGGLEWCSQLKVEYPTPDDPAEDYYRKGKTGLLFPFGCLK